VRRRRRAREIINPVDLELEGIDHIVPDEFESGIANEMLDIRLTTGEEVIQTDDFVPLFYESVAEMGAEESGSAGYENTHRKHTNKTGIEESRAEQERVSERLGHSFLIFFDPASSRHLVLRHG
jgi:hypothetical protein